MDSKLYSTLHFALTHPIRFLGMIFYKLSLALNPILKRDSYLVTGSYTTPKQLRVNKIYGVGADQRLLVDGVNTVLTQTLDEIIDKQKYTGKRVLEIGPKYGHHSMWIDSQLQPSHITLVELSQKDSLTNEWIGKIRCPHNIIFKSFIRCDELLSGDGFDLIFFTGVLYHTVEHFKILNVLRRLLRDDGTLLLQTSVDLTHDQAVILLKWEAFEQAGNFAYPSKSALFKILAMTGWDNINHYIDYRPKSNVVLMTCEKSKNLPIAYDNTSFGGSTI